MNSAGDGLADLTVNQFCVAFFYSYDTRTRTSIRFLYVRVLQ